MSHDEQACANGGAADYKKALSVGAKLDPPKLGVGDDDLSDFPPLESSKDGVVDESKSEGLGLPSPANPSGVSPDIVAAFNMASADIDAILKCAHAHVDNIIQEEVSSRSNARSSEKKLDPVSFEAKQAAITMKSAQTPTTSTAEVATASSKTEHSNKLEKTDNSEEDFVDGHHAKDCDRRDTEAEDKEEQHENEEEEEQGQEECNVPESGNFDENTQNCNDEENTPEKAASPLSSKIAAGNTPSSIRVTVNGITDVLELERLLTVHRSYTETSKMQSRHTKPKPTEIRQQIARKHLPRLVGGRWVLAAPQNKTSRSSEFEKKAGSQSSGKATRKVQRRRERMRRARFLKQGGGDCELQDVSVASIDDSQKHTRPVKKTGGKTKQKLKSSGLALSQQMKPIITTEPLLSEEGTSPSSSHHRNSNWQPWNPILTSAERRRREDRNMKRRLKAAGIPIDRNSARGRKCSPSALTKGDASLPNKNFVAKKVTSQNGTVLEHKIEHRSEREHTRSVNTSWIGSMEKSIGTLELRSVVFIILLSLLATTILLLASNNIGPSVSYTQGSREREPASVVPLGNVETQGINSTKDEDVTLALLPPLRITYPGQGETVLKTESISLRWAFGSRSHSLEHQKPTLPMQLIVNDKYKHDLDEQAKAQGFVRMRQLEAGEYFITLKALGKNEKVAHVSFVVVDVPPGVKDPAALMGELQVLQALSSDELLLRLRNQRVPAVRRQMIEQILEDRQ